MQYDVKVTARMKKIEGQLRGILRMMDEEKDCKDVITQLSAVRSAVDRTIGVIVTDNLVECLSKEDAASLDKNAMVKQAVELLVKSR
ncbi:metal-sensitive transcriptional regulator [Ureibacillus chungkukjangi]|uniref:metal-sensitive transcriptional regulator n=1 Tax=Ureibacillus chungkukjangi TaxID=1202712 RepID=UPI00203C2305|nr:metal-sensitive transcriptional regulator [Ureibacillus chungkukjangi]MCM3389853.1 metal-sensitive transcriptional regulator [Ureibacillus chungkukjangi]